MQKFSFTARTAYRLSQRLINTTKATRIASSAYSANSLSYVLKRYKNDDPRDSINQGPATEDLKGKLDLNDPAVLQAIQKLKEQSGKGKGGAAGDEKDEELEDDASYINDNKRSFYLFSIAAIGLIGGYFIMQLNLMRDEKKTNKNARISYTGKADIGGPWKLVDMEGKEVTSEDLAGSYYMIYFGFCNCPDICPNSLHKLSKALEHIRKMPEGRFFKLKTIFVSVDPDRDDAARMQRFLSLFDKSIIGLTGKSNNSPELKDCMRKFKIYASKIELENEEDEQGGVQGASKKIPPADGKPRKKPYTIDHTIITYLMSDTNEYLAHLGSNMSDYDLSQTIVDKILINEREKAQRKRA